MKFAKSHLLKLTIPGLQNPIDVPFPDKKLPVCAKCKMIFKTRQLCRERDGHTTFPWTNTYICFIIDDSCYEEDKITGKKNIVTEDGPNPMRFTATAIECSSTKYFADFETDAGKSDPICNPCKLKNYTRHYCRTKHQHENLPWGTLYVSLKAEKNETSFQDTRKLFSKKRHGKESHTNALKRMKVESGNDYESDICRATSEDETSSNAPQPFCSTGDIYDKNRKNAEAFLVTISAEHCSFQWLSTTPSGATNCIDVSQVSRLPPLPRLKKTQRKKSEPELNMEKFNHFDHEIESLPSFGSFEPNPESKNDHLLQAIQVSQTFDSFVSRQYDEYDDEEKPKSGINLLSTFTPPRLTMTALDTSCNNSIGDHSHASSNHLNHSQNDFVENSCIVSICDESRASSEMKNRENKEGQHSDKVSKPMYPSDPYSSLSYPPYHPASQMYQQQYYPHFSHPYFHSANYAIGYHGQNHQGSDSSHSSGSTASSSNNGTMYPHQYYQQYQYPHYGHYAYHYPKPQKYEQIQQSFSAGNESRDSAPSLETSSSNNMAIRDIHEDDQPLPLYQ